MKKSNSLINKIIILGLIIFFILASFLMIKLSNKKDSESDILENEEILYQDDNFLIENTIPIEEENLDSDSDNEVCNNDVYIVTREYTSTKHNGNKNFIKVIANGYIEEENSYFENTDEEYANDNSNVENEDKIAPIVTVSYSKKDITNENVNVRLSFNERVSKIENGFILADDGLSATKEYEENTSENVKVFDMAQNDTIVKIEVNNIDKISPQKVEISNDKFETRTIQTQIIVNDLESGINLNGCKYKIDTNAEILDRDGFITIGDTASLIEKNVENDGIYYLHVISMDNAGNSREDTIELMVDTVLPKLDIKYSNKNTTNKDVIVTITSNKAMQEVSGWNFNKDKTIFTKTYTENIEEEINFTDSIGRKVIAHIIIDNIDKVDPVEPKISQNIFNNKTIDNTKDIDISLVTKLSDNENGSGLDLSKCKYILNQNQEAPTNFDSTNTFTKSEQTLYFTIKENSTYYLHILLVDYAGNEKITTQTIISDTLNPIVTREYSTKDITNQNVTVTIKSNETLKGCDGWAVYDNGKTLRKEFCENIERTIYRFYDIAGNSVAVDVTISNIDKSVPNDSKINNDIFNTLEFNVVTNISDVGFGLDLNECKYIFNSKKESDFANAMTFKNENETLKLKVEKDGVYYLHTLLKDKAGNEKITTHKITIDTTRAKLDVKYSNKQMTNNNVTVTIISNEDIQVVPGWELSSDKKQLTKIFESNENTVVEVKDIAGNITECNVIVENIDKTKPNIDVSYSTTSQTIEPVEVKIVANEKIQSIEGWKLSEDGTTLCKMFFENTSQTITIRDIAGNITTTSIIIGNIM